VALASIITSSKGIKLGGKKSVYWVAKEGMTGTREGCKGLRGYKKRELRLTALANAYEDTICHERFNRDEVSGDDSEVVPVNAELELTIDGRVDEAKKVTIPTLEDGLELLAGAKAVRVGAPSAAESVGTVDEGVLQAIKRRDAFLG
jgi:hypothetical protein